MAVNTTQSGEQRDVIALLDDEDRAIEGLLVEFGTPEAGRDHVKRADIGIELRDRLAVQEAAKQELVHAVLRDSGPKELAEEIDGRARKRRHLLVQLDELTSGVSARDVHAGGGEEFDRTVFELRDLLGRDLIFERENVIPLLRAQLSPEELQRLGSEVDRVRKHAPTHPKEDAPLGHEGSSAIKRIHAVVDHLRDFSPDAPHHSEDRQ